MLTVIICIAAHATSGATLLRSSRRLRGTIRVSIEVVATVRHAATCTLVMLRLHRKAAAVVMVCT